MQYHSPLPLLSLFNGKRENSFENENNYGHREVPKPRVVFDRDNPVDGDDPVSRKNESR